MAKRSYIPQKTPSRDAEKTDVIAGVNRAWYARCPCLHACAGAGNRGASGTQWVPVAPATTFNRNPESFVVRHGLNQFFSREMRVDLPFKTHSLALAGAHA